MAVAGSGAVDTSLTPQALQKVQSGWIAAEQAEQLRSSLVTRRLFANSCPHHLQ
jgi:hypothetical protein